VEVLGDIDLKAGILQLLGDSACAPDCGDERCACIRVLGVANDKRDTLLLRR
jgi:hypothetical protein